MQECPPGRNLGLRRATVLLLAHRGASADAPENTLEAFQEAMRQGADGVELDVMLCSTGEVVVCHDERLSRLAGVDWEVAKTPWWKLRRVDIGSLGGRAPAYVPLLEHVLAALPLDKLVNVELKCETLDDGGLTARVVDVLDRAAAAEERVVISSFNAACLWRLAELAPHLRRGYLIDPDKAFVFHGDILAPLVSKWSVHPFWRDCTSARAARWREAGLRIAAWTVDDANEARRLRALGVDYVITNRPGALRSEL
jgi:glycerophosphoryl diester phosphodiesterase